MAGEDRMDRLEEKVAALQTASYQAFGRIEAEIAHLRQLVESTLAQPSPPAPAWLVMVGAGSLLTGIAALLLGAGLLLR